jgi:hypothetical protein
VGHLVSFCFPSLHRNRIGRRPKAYSEDALRRMVLKALRQSMEVRTASMSAAIPSNAPLRWSRAWVRGWITVGAERNNPGNPVPRAMQENEACIICSRQVQSFCIMLYTNQCDEIWWLMSGNKIVGEQRANCQPRQRKDVNTRLVTSSN